MGSCRSTDNGKNREMTGGPALEEGSQNPGIQAKFGTYFGPTFLRAQTTICRAPGHAVVLIEAVCFNSRADTLPKLLYDGDNLPYTDSFKYL
eukprot:40864-Pelagomonas_calceolata.AAC.3